jgi:hypothetical protein
MRLARVCSHTARTISTWAIAPDSGRAARVASAPAAPTGGLRPRDPDCWAIEGDRVVSCDALPSPKPKAPILVPDSAEPGSCRRGHPGAALMPQARVFYYAYGICMKHA